MNKKPSKLTFTLEDDKAEEADQPVTTGNPGRKLAATRLPVDLIDAAKIYAVKHKTSIQSLIEEGLRQRIDYI